MTFWLIDFDDMVSVTFKTIRMIALGEFLDDLEIGKKILAFIGLELES